MFEKSILVLLKSGLKLITSYTDRTTYEDNLEYLITNYKEYTLNNNYVLMVLNNNGECIYFTTADILNIVTLNTPKNEVDLSVNNQVH